VHRRAPYTDVAPLDQIRVTLDHGTQMFTPPGLPMGSLPLPMRFAIELPATTTNALLDFDGFDQGELLRPLQHHAPDLLPPAVA